MPDSPLHQPDSTQPDSAAARRAEQARAFRRNQVYGLLLLAALILLWWIFHTNPAWLFPPGWWRF